MPILLRLHHSKQKLAPKSSVITIADGTAASGSAIRFSAAAAQSATVALNGTAGTSAGIWQTNKDQPFNTPANIATSAVNNGAFQVALPPYSGATLFLIRMLVYNQRQRLKPRGSQTMFTMHRDIKTPKDMDRRFSFKATLVRNTMSGLCLVAALVLIGLVAGEGINLLVVGGMGLLFIPIGICIDQAWYHSYKKKLKK